MRINTREDRKERFAREVGCMMSECPTCYLRSHFGNFSSSLVWDSKVEKVSRRLNRRRRLSRGSRLTLFQVILNNILQLCFYFKMPMNVDVHLERLT